MLKSFTHTTACYIMQVGAWEVMGLVYRADLLDKIAKENEEAEQRVATIRQPDEDRFQSKLDALWGKGVPFEILGYSFEFKFSMRSWAFLETNNIHDAEPADKVLLFAMASTLHDPRIKWNELFQNGYQLDREFQVACMEAWELSKPLPPTCPPDKIGYNILSKRPKPGGFGIDYMSMLITLGKQFGWTKDEFWAMSPREVALILDEYNWDVHYQNLIEKAHIKQSKRGR